MPIIHAMPNLMFRLGVFALIAGAITFSAIPAEARRCARRCCAPCYGITSDVQVSQPPATTANNSQPPKSLFDGKTLAGWESVNFGGEGDVLVKDGQLILETGVSLTGVVAKFEPPKTNYEISLEAMRVDGIDFFCGLTFPVGDSHCSFIAGGWAGAVVGLSSIDGEDAARNATTKYMSFKDGQWYKIRVRVTPEKIACWIDEKQVVDQSLAGKKISVRNEVKPCRPLGLCTWQTTAAIRNIELRQLQGGAGN